jgi:hypothetical protein
MPPPRSNMVSRTRLPWPKRPANSELGAVGGTALYIYRLLLLLLLSILLLSLLLLLLLLLFLLLLCIYLYIIYR